VDATFGRCVDREAVDMKPLVISTAIVVVLVLHQLWVGPALERMATESLGEEARLAIELRCGDAQTPAARTCRADLERLYASGSLDPERTLRAYCAEVTTAPWGRRNTSPPPVCVERYGSG
jgi:hypothetical protein